MFVGGGDKARAQVYRQLATLERAGVPALQAFEQASRGAAGVPFDRVRQHLRDGDDVATAFASVPAFSRLEAAVVAAGTAGGTLPQSYNQLADLLEDRAKVKTSLVASLAYPVFLLHLALILPSLGVLFDSQDGGLIAYLMVSLVPILVAYAAVAAAWVGWKTAGQQASAARDAFVLRIPVVGAIVRKSSLSMGFKALEVLYAGGVPLLKALELAARATPNAVLAGAFERCAERVAGGQDVAEGFAREVDIIGSQSLRLIETGSQTGQLDAMLATAAETQAEEAKQARTLLVWALGGFAFLCAAFLVGYKIISTFAGIYSKVL
jgi:type IV pilus assembly protein PilC